MEPTAKSSQKPAINDTSLLACLPEPVLELVLAAAGPRARMRSARCSRGVQDAALLPDKYWREAYAQRWWHARALAAPQAAGAFAARVKGERACCDLLVALAETGNQLTWRQKHDCIERAGDGACELLARVAAATNVYSEPHTPTAERSEPHTPVAGARLRPPPSRNTTAAWRSHSSSAGPTPTLLSTQSAVGTQSALTAFEEHRRQDVSTHPLNGRVRSSCSVNQCTLSGGRRRRRTGATSPSGKQNHSNRLGSGGRGPPSMPPFTGARFGNRSRISAGRRAGGSVPASSRNAAQPTTTASSIIPAGTGSTRSISRRSPR